MRIAMIGQKGIETGERGGGIEQHVEAVGRRLVQAGHDVFVYGRKPLMPGKGRKIQGMHIIYTPSLHTKNLEAITHTFFSTLHALFGSYDIIHYHGVGPATLAWIPRLLLRHTRVVVTFHSQDQFHAKWSWFAKHYLAFGEWAAVRFPHACIATSHVLQVFCRQRFGREVIYIPNGAERHDTMETDRLEELGVEPGNYLLNVGRIVAHKGLHYLVDAYLALASSARTDLPQLVIVGAPSFTDDYFARLKARAKGHPRILFLGFQKGEALAQLFSRALLYVHPSESEGLPLVILEAMSYGRPILASDIPENQEAMTGGAVRAGEAVPGFSFRSGDVEDLTQQLRFCLNHPEERKKAGMASLRIVETFFNWDLIASHIEEVYRTIRH